MYIHGNAGSIDNDYSLGYESTFLSQGFGFFMYDLLGRGKTGLDRLNKKKAKKMSMTDLMNQAKEMVGVCLVEKLRNSNFSADGVGNRPQVFLMGRSLGGYITSWLLNLRFYDENFEIKGVCLLCPAIDRRPLIFKEHLTEDQRKMLISGQKLDFEYETGKTVALDWKTTRDHVENWFFFENAKRENFSGMDYPLKVVAGRRDFIAPVSTSERFLELVDQPKWCELIVSDGGDHTFKDPETQLKVQTALKSLMDIYQN